jgi:hypothetical protein
VGRDGLEAEGGRNRRGGLNGRFADGIPRPA